jgi:hypothetical protein
MASHAERRCHSAIPSTLHRSGRREGGRPDGRRADVNDYGLDGCVSPRPLASARAACLLRLSVSACRCDCAPRRAGPVGPRIGALHPSQFRHRRAKPPQMVLHGSTFCLSFPFSLPAPLRLPSLPKRLLTGLRCRATAATDAAQRGPLRLPFVAVRARGDARAHNFSEGEGSGRRGVRMWHARVSSNRPPLSPLNPTAPLTVRSVAVTLCLSPLAGTAQEPCRGKPTARRG